MKKKIIIVFVCLGAASICHAGGYAMPVLVSAPDTSTVQAITGTIATVSIADSAKNLRSEIVIEDHAGQQHVLIVKATTTIYDPSWKPTVLDMLRKNDHVKIKYVLTVEGVAEALSIKKYSR